jgi:hypothetical protein
VPPLSGDPSIATALPDGKGQWNGIITWQNPVANVPPCQEEDCDRNPQGGTKWDCSPEGPNLYAFDAVTDIYWCQDYTEYPDGTVTCNDPPVDPETDIPEDRASGSCFREYVGADWQCTVDLWKVKDLKDAY